MILRNEKRKFTWNFFWNCDLRTMALRHNKASDVHRGSRFWTKAKYRSVVMTRVTESGNVIFVLNEKLVPRDPGQTYMIKLTNEEAFDAIWTVGMKKLREKAGL